MLVDTETLLVVHFFITARILPSAKLVCHTLDRNDTANLG